jgi:hypothetical protein
MSLESEKAPPLPKRMYTEEENPSKPPTEVHQLAPQDIEQRIVDISLESEKALPCLVEQVDEPLLVVSKDSRPQYTLC